MLSKILLVYLRIKEDATLSYKDGLVVCDVNVQVLVDGELT